MEPLQFSALSGPWVPDVAYQRACQQPCWTCGTSTVFCTVLCWTSSCDTFFTDSPTISSTGTSGICSTVPRKIRSRLGILDSSRTCSSTCGTWTSLVCSLHSPRQRALLARSREPSPGPATMSENLCESCLSQDGRMTSVLQDTLSQRVCDGRMKRAHDKSGSRCAEDCAPEDTPFPPPPPHHQAAGAQYFVMDAGEDVGEAPAAGRPAPLSEVLLQVRVQRHTVEHRVEACPVVQILDAPVPQGENQLVEVCGHLDTPIPEQAIEVPKIHSSPQSSQVTGPPHANGGGTVGWKCRNSCCLLSCSSSRSLTLQFPRLVVEFLEAFQGFLPGQNYTLFPEQIVDTPVPRRGGLGLQGFLPGQIQQRLVEHNTLTFQFRGVEVLKVYAQDSVQLLHPLTHLVHGSSCEHGAGDVEGRNGGCVGPAGFW